MSMRERARYGRRQHRNERKHTSDQHDAPHHRGSRHQREEALESSRNGRGNHDELEHSRRRSPLKALKSLQVSPSGQERSIQVQCWLGQIDGVRENTGKENRPYTGNFPMSIQQDEQSRLTRHDQGRPGTRSKQAAISHLQSLQKASNHREHRPERSKTRHARPKCHTSSDSSFLQPIGSPQPSREPSKVLLEDIEKKLSKAQQSNHKRKRSLSNSVSSEADLPHPEEVFHKRPRHKTKEDRYETKARKGKSKGEEKSAKPKSNTPKRGDAAKISRAAGDQLIRSFASNKIAQDRLTMRPGAGIFLNGKASYPSRHRGISDLAFSEMDFLSHPKAKPGATEKEVVTSKHGQKIQRERERTRNEISTYFASRQAAHTVDAHNTPAALFAPRFERDATVAFSDYGRTSYGHDESPAQPPIVKEQFLGFGTNISSPRKFSLPAAPQQPIYVRPSVETDLSTSSSSTSYVSWSVTAKSDSRSIRREKRPRLSSERDITDSSSSPSVLRKRLLDSGLLEGLGMGRCGVSPNNAQSHRVSLSQEDDFTEEIQLHGIRYPRAGSGASVSPLSYQTTYRERSHSHVGELRRRQIEAARRVIESSGRADVQDGQDSGVPRSVLAMRAYLPLPSSVPRRPATTTPVRPSSQNRVLSRSSLPHEILREGRRRGAQPQLPEAALDDMDTIGHGAEICEGQHMNFTPHAVTPNYGDTDERGQPWAEGGIAAHAEDETPAVDYGERPTESEPAYYAFDDMEGTHYEQEFAQSEQYCPDERYYQKDIRQEGFEIEEPAPNYEDQPSHLHALMNQYFQTPRGQSYFQQRSLERPNLQDDSCQASVLDEDQLKGFWATKRW